MGSQKGVHEAMGSLTRSVELSGAVQPVQLVMPSTALLELRFLHAWLMATHSWSWNGGGLCKQWGEPNEGSVHPATYVFPDFASQQALASPRARQ